MKIETSKLVGAALDWAVAKAEDMVFRPVAGRGSIWFEFGIWTKPEQGGAQTSFVTTHELKLWNAKCDGPVLRQNTRIWTPSTDWAQGGPIIRRERLNLEPFNSIQFPLPEGGWCSDGVWESLEPLVAAMRCFVASKLGDEVDVPEELL